jgi:hypothetical protein
MAPDRFDPVRRVRPISKRAFQPNPSEPPGQPLIRSSVPFIGGRGVTGQVTTWQPLASRPAPRPACIDRLWTDSKTAA